VTTSIQDFENHLYNNRPTKITRSIIPWPTSADGYVDFIGTDASGNSFGGDLSDYSGGGCDRKSCPLILPLPRERG
jgi:hypothetical protein